jgi:hypothetical protein
MSDGMIINPYRFGAAPFSPLSLSPVAWFDASDSATITASGSPLKVSQWNNKGSLGNITQATGSAQPTTGATTQNGLNVLDFDGGDHLLVGTANDWKFLHDGTNYIIAAVVRYTNTSNGMLLGNVQGNINERGIFLYRVSTNTLSHYVQTGSGYTSAVDNGASLSLGTTAAVVTILADPGNGTAADRSAVARNAGSVVKNNIQTATPSASDPTQPLAIGAARTTSGGGSAGFGMIGWIAELIIVSGANATEANRTALRDYLNTKWAVY